MLSASYTLTLKDQRIFISNTEFTWKTTWRTLWLWLCEITVSNFSFFSPLFCCSHAEIQKKHEQLSRKEQEKVLFAEKLTSLISEELQKGMAAISSETFRVFCLYLRSVWFFRRIFRALFHRWALFWLAPFASLPAACILFAFWWNVFPRFPTAAFIVRFDWFLSSVLFSRAFRRLSVFFFCSNEFFSRHPFFRPFFFSFVLIFYFFFLIKCCVRFFSCLPCLVSYFYAIVFQTFFRLCRFKSEAVVYDGPIAKH